MSLTLGLVEICSSQFSTAQAERLAERRLAGRSLLHWIVRRVTDSIHLDRVVVLADTAHKAAAMQHTPADATVFVAPQPDALGRVAAAVQHFGANQIVRVTLDNPFVDPSLIDRLICTANTNPGCDYIGYYLHSGLPAVRSTLGVFAEWCRGEALLQANQLARDADERQAVTRYVYSHPEQFQLRLIPVPQELDRRDVRLRMHSDEDWEHAQAIIDAIGADDLDWHSIARLLNAQPEMRQRMAVLNQAQEG